jgi:hypothetical protein
MKQQVLNIMSVFQRSGDRGGQNTDRTVTVIKKMFRKMFVKEETDVNAKKGEYVSKDSEVVQSASSVASNAGILKKSKVSFKDSQSGADEPKFRLSENERSTVGVPLERTRATVGVPLEKTRATVGVPLEKTRATVDAPVVFGETETRINKGSLVLSRSKVISKETEISFREADIPQEAVEAPLLFKEAGKRTSEGSIVFVHTKISTDENEVIFEREKSFPVGITETAIPFTERHRTTMDTPTPYTEKEGVMTDVPVLILDEEGNMMDASAHFTESDESTRNTPVVFIDTERATMDSPVLFSKDEEPSPSVAASSRLSAAYRQATEAFQQVPTIFRRVVTINKPRLIGPTSDRGVAQESPRNRTDTYSQARRRSQSPGTARVSAVNFRRYYPSAVCPCSIL